MPGPDRESTDNKAPRRGRPPQRATGENSRGELLDAALRCIARDGLAGATHRAIAKEAKLSLSLTTYFFSSRDDLLEQAFERFAAQTLLVSQSRLDDLAPLIAASIGTSNKLQIEGMTDYIARFILRDTPERSFGNAIEVSFLFAHQQNGRLRELVDAYRRELVRRIARTLVPFALPDPETAASILLGTVHRLEYDRLHTPTPAHDEQVYREINCLLGMLFGLHPTTALP